MAHIRHPIIGDSTHGDLYQNRGVAQYVNCPRLMLHTSHLSLSHPISGEMLNLSALWDQPWQGMMSQFGWAGRVPQLERAKVGIFIGTVYGNALLVAEEVENILMEQGHEVKLFDEGTREAWQFYRQHYVLLITSTTGQRELPGNIAQLYRAVRELGFQPDLRYGVIALGDSSYESFCGGGHLFDSLLQEQGATRVGEMLEIDSIEEPEPETVARLWIEQWGTLLK